ncbi:MAG: hypothetical protein Q7T63_13880, partial [Burkholderiaceae bacterium]|nr:hypothetical protein [Burkholderiaceae bacterium]
FSLANGLQVVADATLQAASATHNFPERRAFLTEVCGRFDKNQRSTTAVFQQRLFECGLQVTAFDNSSRGLTKAVAQTTCAHPPNC